MRPIVDIYSTFLQRSFDHIFQEVALQDLPVTFMLDRGGLSGPDGADAPRRVRPRATCGSSRIWSSWRPATPTDVAPMLDFALQHEQPVRDPLPEGGGLRGRRATVHADRARQGRSPPRRPRRRPDRRRRACSVDCLAAADRLCRRSSGLDLTVVNARFIKPLDTAKPSCRSSSRARSRSPSKKRRPRRRLRQRPCSKRATKRASRLGLSPQTPRHRRITTSNTATAASCWPTLASTPQASPRPAGSWR